MHSCHRKSLCHAHAHVHMVLYCRHRAASTKFSKSPALIWETGCLVYMKSDKSGYCRETIMSSVCIGHVCLPLSALGFDFLHFNLDLFLLSVLICFLFLMCLPIFSFASVLVCLSLLSNPLYKRSGLWPWEPNLHQGNHNFRHVPMASLLCLCVCVCVCVCVCSPAVEQMECSLCSRW